MYIKILINICAIYKINKSYDQRKNTVIQYIDDNIDLYIKNLINICVIYEINKSYDWRKEIQLRIDDKF